MTKLTLFLLLISSICYSQSYIDSTYSYRYVIGVKSFDTKELYEWSTNFKNQIIIGYNSESELSHKRISRFNGDCSEKPLEDYQYLVYNKDIQQFIPVGKNSYTFDNDCLVQSDSSYYSYDMTSYSLNQYTLNSLKDNFGNYTQKLVYLKNCETCVLDLYRIENNIYEYDVEGRVTSLIIKDELTNQFLSKLTNTYYPDGKLKSRSNFILNFGNWIEITKKEIIYESNKTTEFIYFSMDNISLKLGGKNEYIYEDGNLITYLSYAFLEDISEYILTYETDYFYKLPSILNSNIKKDLPIIKVKHRILELSNLNAKESYEILIYNANGQMMYSKLADKQDSFHDEVLFETSGLFFISVVTGHGIITSKSLVIF